MLKSTVISLILGSFLFSQAETNIIQSETNGAITYSHFGETTAYLEGFSLLSILSPVIIIPEYKYDLMLKDALFGKKARKDLIPKLESALKKIEWQWKAAEVVQKSLELELSTYRKKMAMAHFKYFMFTVGGISVGVGMTIGMYYLVSKSRTW
jgi:hypothetical protein